MARVKRPSKNSPEINKMKKKKVTFVLSSEKAVEEKGKTTIFKKAVGTSNNGISSSQEAEDKDDYDDKDGDKDEEYDGYEDEDGNEDHFEDSNLENCPKKSLCVIGTTRQDNAKRLTLSSKREKLSTLDTTEQRVDLREIETHCRPSAVSDLVNRLNDTQKQHVKDIGFGGMLLVKMTSFYKHMVMWLLTHFNPHGLVLRAEVGKEFLLKEDDVFDVFGLPRGKKEVVLIKKLKKKKNPDAQFMFEVRNMLKLSENETLTTSMLPSFIVNLSEGGPDFKKLFVLYVCSVFLTPTSNGHVDLFLSKAVADADDIVNLNWCSFVLNTLCEAVDKWQGRKAKLGEMPKRVKGCILLLEIVYFHRFMFKGETAPKEIPLIQHWTDEIVNKRLQEELKAGFGTSPLDCESYPICKKVKNQEKDQKNDNSNVSSLHSGVDTVNSSTVGRILQIELPDGLLTDDEITLKANDEFHAKILRVQRDLDLMLLINMRRLQELKDDLQQKQHEAEHQGEFIDQTKTEEPDAEPELSQMEILLRDPANIAQIDQLVDKIIQMRALAKSMPSFNLLDPEDCLDASTRNIIKEVIESIDQESEDVEEHAEGKSLHVQSNNDIGEDLLSLFSSFNCGPPSSSKYFISSHMHENQKLMKNLPSLQQEVADYSLLDFPKTTDLNDFGLHQMESLFVSSQFVISRNEMQNLSNFEKVSTAVIRVWSFLLNDLEKKNEQLRFFFGVDHIFFLEKLVEGDAKQLRSTTSKLHNSLRSWISETCSLDHVLSASMIFVPILFEDHFYCVVINFNLEEIQYLDNRMYRKDDFEKFSGIALMLVEELATVLKILKDKRWSKISRFELKNIEFSWQSKNVNVDCGVFMMLHMLFFKGTTFKADFHKDLRRRVYRSSICAAIVLHDMNESRSEILNKVEVFKLKKNKDVILSRIIEQKRIAAVEKRKLKLKK